MKPALGGNIQVSADIPNSEFGFQFPIAILDKRLCTRASKVITQILVHWSRWSVSMATWEDEHVIKELFPKAPARGQADSQGGC